MAPFFFRDANYNKRVILGKRTIKAGEAAIIWNLKGEVSRELCSSLPNAALHGQRSPASLSVYFIYTKGI